jgi:drug/metabolite transporter (DMT)-like permease
VAALVYLEPPVTLVWAALMFGDVIYASTYIGIAVVVAGLILVRLKQPAAACTS